MWLIHITFAPVIKNHAMDSLTQAALGAGIAGTLAPRGQRRKALLLGAALGTLPDLDVLIDYGDAVGNFTRHRGFSHSLFVLGPFALLLWWLMKRAFKPVAEAPGRWLAVISLALLTHPLLDAHTAYGTQLFWPLQTPPISWATLFIIDPLFTLPLLIGVLAVLAGADRQWGETIMRGALTISCCYLLWSWVAQGIVREHARESLAERGLGTAPLFITPTPFNTLLWRVVVLTPDGYLEGFDSLLLDEADPDFKSYSFDRTLLQAADSVPAVARLQWFSLGFVRADLAESNQLQISDLRMGQEPLYVFTHRVAEAHEGQWKAIRSERLPFDYDRALIAESLSRIWQRAAASPDGQAIPDSD